MSVPPEDSREDIAYEIRGTFRAFENALIAALLEKDLTVGFFHILRINWPDQGYTQKEIADLAFMTPSVASQQIQKMCKLGLLRREADKSDVRKKIVRLTEKGRTQKNQVIPPIVDIPKVAAEAISDQDIQATINVLRELRQNLK
jgi:DNA-binding MarR family transcriptional regulator